jgi:hypothetical protein
MPASKHKYLPVIVGHPVRGQLLALDTRPCVNTASNPFYTAFQARSGGVPGGKPAALGDGGWNIAGPGLLNEPPDADGKFNDVVMEHEFPAQRRRKSLGTC